MAAVASQPNPIGSAKNRCTFLSDAVESLPTSKVPNSCKRSLLRLLAGELRFLSALPIPVRASEPISFNIGYLDSVVRILQLPWVTKVSRVCKAVPGQPPQGSVHVDVICTLRQRPAWLLVSDRNPKYLSWQGSKRNKGVRARVEQVVAAARDARSLKPESVVLFFCRGIEEDVAENLVGAFGAEEIGVEDVGLECGTFEEVEDGWVSVSFRKCRVFDIKVLPGVERAAAGELNIGTVRHAVDLRRASELGSGDAFGSLVSSFVLPSYMSVSPEGLVNLDTTALIALVSGVSNGAAGQLLNTPEADLRKRFKGNYEFVTEQVKSELNEPIVKEISLLIAQKKPMICESVLSEFKEIVSLCGGPKEKLRADLLLSCLKVVPDSPSTRMIDLPTTRKIAMKSKIIFGTGDNWRVPTLTANMGFVRAISQTGMALLTIEHRPRALTGD